MNLYAYCANNPVVYYDPSGYAYEANGQAVENAKKENATVDAGESGTLEGTGNKIIDGFSEVESKIIYEAKDILASPEFDKIRKAHEMGESVTVNINGRTIQYEPGLNSSGMTLFGDDGFLIGNEVITRR